MEAHHEPAIYDVRAGDRSYSGGDNISRKSPDGADIISKTEVISLFRAVDGGPHHQIIGNWFCIFIMTSITATPLHSRQET